MKFNWSEIFISIEGEAMYAGHPTVYIRFTNCNFTCRGFNNPDDVEITNEVLGFDPADFHSLPELPGIEIGCDSIYSWDKRFKHMWHKGDADQLAAEVMNALPHNSWINPTNGSPVILSLTGGEPTLHAKTIPTLLNHPSFTHLGHLLIETNCAVPLSDEFIEALGVWSKKGLSKKITWSNSPKLAVSGEPWDKAIIPEVALQQLSLRSKVTVPGYVDQYFKFVSDGSDSSFNEVSDAMQTYYTVGVPHNTPVYIMPMACTEDQQVNVAAVVANQCINRGYIYCHRLQNSIWGNTIGT